MKRREFLRLTATATLAVGVPWVGRAAASDAPSETELLADAAKRIEQHRTREVVVALRTKGGRAVRGARVKVEQARHEFLFGCNAFGYDRGDSEELKTAYAQRFAALCNAATLGFYWAAYEPEEGKPDYATTDRAVQWCQAQGITPKGHPLVWDHAVSSPNWLPPDLTEVGELSAERVKAIMTRYRGRIELWDVVNEPRHLGNPHFRREARNHMAQWAAGLGPEAYTAGHLRVARQADPQARLTVNDYQVDAGYLALLDSLKERGKFLFDVVGLQSHMHGAVWPLSRVWETCEMYRVLGLPLHFTEITVLSGPRLGPGENWGPTEPALEATQADYVERLYTLLFSHPAVGAAIWWDLSDRGAWQRAAAGLLRADLSPKPAYERLHALIKGRWWTKAQGETNAAGDYKLRVFRGRHNITVTLPNGTELTRIVSWEGSRPARCEVVVP